MSDFSRGPGWWVAADGKWYPPHLHPAMGPPPPPPPPSSMLHASVAAVPVAAPAAWGAGVYGGAPGTNGWAGPVVGDVDPVLGLRLAPWWKRLIAIIIDNLILGLAVFFLFLIIGIATAPGSENGSASSSPTPHGGALIAGILIWVVLVSIPLGLYYGIMNGRSGQTVGKKALSIAVRDARTGTTIGFWRGFGRFMITVLFSLLLYVPYVIDSLAPLWDKRNQSWHDRVAHTIVIDLKP